MLDRGAHRVKFGAYYFHLQFRPEQPDNARGAFTYTGQFSGNAFADFLLGYPTSAVAGIGRGDEDGRTNWVHLFAQDDWRMRRNLTVNLGLRYEYNQHMRDRDNRLSSVDYVTPGGRFVIASDEDGAIDPAAQALLAADSASVRHVRSRPAGIAGCSSPSKVRLAPRTGFALSLNDDRAVIRGGYGIFLNQWAYSVQTAFARNLPFFFTKQVDVPATQRVPAFQTRDILASDPTGVVAPTIMDHDYRGRVHADMERRAAVRTAAVDDGWRWRTWGRGRSARTTRPCTTCPSPARGRSRPSSRFRSSVPSDRSDSTASRSITA